MKFFNIVLFSIIIFLSTPIVAKSIEYIKINKLEIISEDNIDKDFWLKFINLPEESFITYKEIEFFKKRLLNTKSFKKVFIKVKKEGKLNKLKFYLVSKPIVRRINIKGNFPILDQDIQRKIFFSEGDYFNKEKYLVIKDNLLKLFRVNGYYNTDIRTSYKFSNDYKHITINIDIKDIGVSLSIGDINVIYKKDKNKEYKNKIAKKIKKLLSPSFLERKSETFSEDNLKKQLKLVETKLRKEGYISLRLKLLKLSKKEISSKYSKEQLKSKYLKVNKRGSVIHFKSKKVDLWIAFEVADKIKIKFKGANSISVKELKDQISLHEKATLSPSNIKKSIQKLKQFYQSSGFYFIDITYDLKKIKKNQKELVFNIKEGNKLYIRNIKFKGVSKAIGESTLLDLMDTGTYNLLGSQGYLQEKLFLKDIKTILEYYKKKGYLHTKVKDLIFSFYHKESYLDIEIYLSEGEKVKFDMPKIYGSTKKELKNMQNSLKEATETGFSYEWFKYNATAIQQYYESIGYPLVKVSAYIVSNNKRYLFYPLSKKFGSEDEVLAKLHGKLQLEYLITRGPRKKFGSIFITGNFDTEKSTIDNEIMFKKNTKLMLEKISETEERLRSLGIFKTISIQVPSLKDTEGVRDSDGMPVDILFFLEEAENRYIDFLVSTSTNEAWSFSTEIVEKNLLGYAKKVSLLGKLGEIYKKVELGFLSPNIFSTQINLNIKTYYKYETPPAFNLTVVGSEISLYKTFFRKLTFSPAILFEYSKTEKTSSNSLDDVNIFQDIETSLTNSMKLSLFYESRDSLFDPRNGFAFKYSFQWAGLFDTLSDKLVKLIDINVSNEKFIKNEFEFSFYLSPAKWITFANSIKIGIGMPIQTIKEKIPTKERYFLGGDSSVRGYDFNMAGIIEDGFPQGDNAMFLFNSEVRFYLKNNISFALFSDIGLLSTKLSDFLESKRWNPITYNNAYYSLGFGIRYITIVGPLRFDFVPNISSKYINKGTTFWHFNFSYPF